MVLGVNGQLGWELCRMGEKQGFDILAFDLPELDITDPSVVNRVVCLSGASVVINAAAYTAVDQAESEQELAFTINCDGQLTLLLHVLKSEFRSFMFQQTTSLMAIRKAFILKQILSLL